jgi:DNA-directed RNA polymerase specialized sigma24 family protein
MSPYSQSQGEIARQRLSGLREQRKAQRVATDELHERTRIAIADAQALGVPVAEIARLLDMDRSSVYRTYVQTDST